MPRAWIALLAVVLALLPSEAEAHLVITGLGPVYDGIAHFSLSPEEVFPVAALSLFAGLRGPTQARAVFFTLPAAWLSGGMLGWAGLTLPSHAELALTAVLFLTAGGLLAAEAPVPVSVTVGVALLLGMVRGSIDIAGLGSGSHAWLSLVGVAATVSALSALAASLSLPLKLLWTRIAVRVAGSWLAALGLLMFGWSIHLAQLAAR